MLLKVTFNCLVCISYKLFRVAFICSESSLQSMFIHPFSVSLDFFFIFLLFIIFLKLTFTYMFCISDKLLKEIRDLNFEVVVQVDSFLPYLFLLYLNSLALFHTHTRLLVLGHMEKSFFSDKEYLIYLPFPF